MIATAAGLALVAGIGLGACSDNESGTQPAPDVSTFQQGDFGDIPLPGSTEQIGERTETDGVVTASYSVDMRTGGQLAEWFDRELAERGWQTAVVPQETAEALWRADWVKDGRRLELSTASYGTADLEAGELLQFSLTLSPDTENSPVFTGDTEPPGPDD